MPAHQETTPKKLKWLLFICGITTVLPWNFFMSAYDYYIIKLKVPILDAQGRLLVSNDTCNLKSACEEQLESYLDQEKIQKLKDNFQEKCKPNNGNLLDHPGQLSCACSDTEKTEANETYHCFNGIEFGDAQDVSMWQDDFQEISPLANTTLPEQWYQSFWNSSLSIVTMLMMLVSSLVANSDFVVGNLEKDVIVRVCLKCLSALLFINTLLIFPKWFNLFNLSVSMFFLATIALALLINFFSGVYQTTMFQISSSLPTRLFNFFIQGQAAGGIFANLIALFCGFLADEIYTLDCNGGENAIDPELQNLRNKSLLALIFFSTAIVIVVLTLYAYNQMARFREGAAENKKLLDHDNETTNLKMDAGEDPSQMPIELTSASELADGELNLDGLGPEDASFLGILKRTYLHYLTVFIVFMGTLAFFPTLLNEIKPTSNFYLSWSPSSKRDQCEMYQFNPIFMKVSILLMFNLGDYLGRIMADYCQLCMNKENSGKLGLVYGVLRTLVFWFFFKQTNVSGYIPRSYQTTGDEIESGHAFNVYKHSFFHEDWVVTVLVLLFGLTNGWLSSLALTFIPKQFPPHQKTTQGKAGGYSITILTLGLMFGSFLSLGVTTPWLNKVKKQSMETALSAALGKNLQDCQDTCGQYWADSPGAVEEEFDY